MTRETLVRRVSTRDPGDVASLEALFDSGAIAPDEVVAIFGKTEGNGCVNDFTRAYSVDMLKYMFAERLGCSRDEVAERVAMVMSGFANIPTTTRSAACRPSPSAPPSPAISCPRNRAA